MKNVVFKFKQFEVIQSEKIFKVGTDGVLLGLLTDIITSERILDIGTGTGIVALILAQRTNNTSIIGIDLDENAYHLAKENFNKSPFSERLTAVFGDIKTTVFNEKFDTIVSNPPYFDSQSTLHSKNILARQQVQLNYGQLFDFVQKNVTEKGNFTLIYPYENETDILQIAKNNNLFLNKNIQVKGIENGKIKRNISTFSFIETEIKTETFVLEKAPREYSDEYKILAKDYYLKF